MYLEERTSKSNQQGEVEGSTCFRDEAEGQRTGNRVDRLCMMDKSLYCGLCGDAAAHGPCEGLAAAHTHGPCE
jgi:hypothetical protein